MLQKLFIAGLFAATLQVSATTSFEYLPTNSAIQKEFKSLVSEGHYQQALFAWSNTHRGTTFGQSANGQATLAYLLYRSGMPVTAIEHLFSSVNPRNMNHDLLSLWSTELENSDIIKKGWIVSPAPWQKVVNNQTSRLRIRSLKDINSAFSLAAKLSDKETQPRAEIWWQIATLAPQINHTDSALRALKLLKESGQSIVGQDQIALAYGRILYQRGELDAALEQYLKIPKSSSLWLESVEERAWTYLRKDDYDKALGETITLLSPALISLVGPESYYLANLLSLKVCDYPRIFKNSEEFKKRHSDRLQSLEHLANKGTNSYLPQILERFDKNGLNISSLGDQMKWLPMSAIRDRDLKRSVELRRLIRIELDRAQKLSQNSSGLGSSQTLDTVQQLSKIRSERLRQQTVRRLRTLAKTELGEYRQILNKMHIIEGEVIQRLALDENLKGKRSQLAKVEDKGDVLVFPYNSDEVWLDELDNYKAQAKDCPTLKGASL